MFFLEQLSTPDTSLIPSNKYLTERSPVKLYIHLLPLKFKKRINRKKYDIQIIALHFSVVSVLILLSPAVIKQRAFSARYSILISTGKVSAGITGFYVWLACMCMEVAKSPPVFQN